MKTLERSGITLEFKFASPSVSSRTTHDILTRYTLAAVKEAIPTLGILLFVLFTRPAFEL